MRAGKRWTSASSVAAAGLAVFVGLGGLVVWLRGQGSKTPPPPHVVEAPPQPPSPPAYPFEMQLGSVRGFPVRGEPRGRRLAGPADAVRARLEELYAIGFVDPARWSGGTFPGLHRLFAGDARRGIAGNLGELTLGEVAPHLVAVRPERALVRVRLAVEANGSPVVALARVDFAAAGLFEGGEVDLRHKGEYTLRKTGGAWRIVAYDVRGSIPPPGRVRAAVKGALSPGLPSRDPIFVLAIGSDARPGQPVAAARADSIHILGVAPRSGRATVLGIPRDSFVPIPGVGTRKINEALVYGGPELMVETVRRLTGVPIDAYLLTGFEDFRHAVSSVGGVRVRIPYAMSDVKSGASFPAGRKRLQGREALAFSRNRYDAPGGDFGRSMNQGRVLIAALREFRYDLRRDPTALLRWLVAGARHVETDLSLAELAELLVALPSIEPGRVRNAVVSGSGGTVGGQSVVHLGPAANAMFRDLARDAVLGG